MGWAAGIWAGFGFETGGEVVFGVGKHTGALVSIDDLITNPSMTRTCAFQQESASIGVGLGGSAGFNFVVGYNAALATDFARASGAEFDFSIDLGLGKLDKYFRNMPEMIELVGIAKKFDPTWISIADKMKGYDNSKVLKTVTENLVKNYSGVGGTIAGEPALLAFPLPGLGGGLRLSLKAKADDTTVLTFDTVDLTRP